MYEPWYIAHTSLAPFHDANFRGYGLNKIAHVASLNYYNYTFIVYPTAWLVHRPHEDTAVCIIFHIGLSSTLEFFPNLK